MYIFQIIFSYLLTYITAAPQPPEINNQYETAKNNDTSSLINIRNEDNITEIISLADDSNMIQVASGKTNHPIDYRRTNKAPTEVDTNNVKNKTTEVETPSLGKRLYIIITDPLKKFIAMPKVNTVMRNIGTCVVNGAMELISYFFPSPLIPLIATAAGMIIPFEPVVMLREKMPVTSYRRAIKTALGSFMNTFDRYKDVFDDEDPYMTRRFNRRFMNNNDKKTDKEF